MQPFPTELEPPEAGRALATIAVGTDNGSAGEGLLVHASGPTDNPGRCSGTFLPIRPLTTAPPGSLSERCLAMASEPNPAPSANTQVTAVTDGITRVFTWEDDARIAVRNLGREIVIEANSAGLKTLAAHLLVLAQDGTPDGAHLHLEEDNGLEEGSAALVLERCDDE